MSNNHQIKNNNNIHNYMTKKVKCEPTLNQIIAAGGEDDALSSALYDLTEALFEKGAPISGGLLGGEYGYGAVYEDDTIKMHPYCWCEEESCPYCSEKEPNFHHKPTDLKIWWYKYIGRGMEIEGDESTAAAVIRGCIENLKEDICK